MPVAEVSEEVVLEEEEVTLEEEEVTLEEVMVVVCRKEGSSEEGVWVRAVIWVWERGWHQWEEVLR